ncbi:MAG TPA: nucleotidyltransferase family protein [Thermoanaerobaculia bacterium]|nr:nucleotidyltransferase family protein [Thermoanaerobaculia bacterium]
MSLDLNRTTILKTLETHRDSIHSLGARRLGLFGSFARGEAVAESDLDFVVEFEPGAKSFDGYMDLKDFLEDLFGRPVDLVITEVIKPRLRERILTETIYAPGL